MENCKREEKEINDTNKNKRVNIWRTIKNGFMNGLKTTWMLTKIVVPVYFFVTFLGYTPVLDWISDILAPIMGIVGLPGEASIVLVMGNMVNIYAALGAVASLTLGAKEITILAVMLSFSHSLFMETAVAKKTGISVILVLLTRFSLAIASGVILNIVI
ncbi:nucleoside recognition domain-containing protein [Dethiothermospora halolimnae]|uniref:nucleoside recognition domain-containing protein n=1 Tax=Dethiothermospora halolimnae TaxID=3114390 RepID=UPI003CCC3E6F